MDTACSAVHVFKDPPVVNWKDTDGTIPRDRNTIVMLLRATTPVWIGTGPLIFQTSMGIQYIGSPRRFIGTQEIRNSKPLETTIIGITAKHKEPEPTWSKIISRKFSKKSNADVNFHCQINLTRDTILTESPNFMGLGISYVHTTNELGSVFIPTTTIGSPMHGSN